MKGFKKFLSNIFSDYGIMNIPHTDAQTIMYSYITFRDVDKRLEAAPKEKCGQLINFTDFKLRRA